MKLTSEWIDLELHMLASILLFFLQLNFPDAFHMLFVYELNTWHQACLASVD